MPFRFGSRIVGFQIHQLWVLNSLVLSMVVLHLLVNVSLEDDYSKGLGMSISPILSRYKD